MSEKLHSTPEQPKNAEARDSLSHEHQERLQKNIESKSDATEKYEQVSLDDITKIAIDTAPSIAETKSNDKIPAQKRSLITQRQRTIAFDKQMNSIQQEMSGPERRFSKVIHSKPIEKTSDTLAATIARPNALLAGSISAFILVTLLYFVAKHYGYRLSGFETIAAFGFGWALGIIYDYARLLITGKRQR